MIDFATLKGVSIPEGNVTQITDAGGVVLWSAGGDAVTVTFNSGFSYGQQATVDGKTYNSSSGRPVFDVPAGSVMEFTLTPEGCDCGRTKGYSYVYVNGSLVHTGRANSSYLYTINGNIAISAEQSTSSCKDCDEKYYKQTIRITEE